MFTLFFSFSNFCLSVRIQFLSTKTSLLSLLWTLYPTGTTSLWQHRLIVSKVALDHVQPSSTFWIAYLHIHTYVHIQIITPMHLLKNGLLRTWYCQTQACNLRCKISRSWPFLTSQCGIVISENSVQTRELTQGISNWKGVSVGNGVLTKLLDGLKRKSRGHHWTTYFKGLQF